MSRLVVTLAAATAFTAVTPALAQDHSMGGMKMPGMSMPMPAKKAPPKKPAAKRPAAKPAPRSSAARPAPAPAKPSTTPSDAMPGMDMSGSHAGHDMTAMPGMAQTPVQGAPPAAMPGMPGMADQAKPDAMQGMDMSGGDARHDMTAMPGMAQTGTALPAGNAPAPAPPMEHYADRQFTPAEMDHARSQMMREQGGQSFYMVMFNLAEYQARRGRDGYRWDGEAWFGGDINRLTLKTEGEGAFREGVESAEVQALYSRAIGPYFNFQAGVRHDFQPSPNRTYATVGFEGLAPYWFEVEGALFLSNKGDLLGRLEGYYDQRITQRLILQPRVELNLAAQDVPENRLGSGLTNAELGLRLRYEIERQFAPYIGISYDRKVGDTARFARADGERVQATSLVAGIRFWF